MKDVKKPLKTTKTDFELVGQTPTLFGLIEALTTIKSELENQGMFSDVVVCIDTINLFYPDKERNLELDSVSFDSATNALFITTRK